MLSSKKILQQSLTKNTSFFTGVVVLCFTLLSLLPVTLKAQVISNNGAKISISSGTVVVTDSIKNSSGTTQNNGILIANTVMNGDSLKGTGKYTIAGSLTNTGTFVAGDSISIGGDWINNGGTFTPGTSTVNMNGISSQSIGGTTPTPFNNLTISNAVDTSAANYKTTAYALTVAGTLTINSGNTLDMVSFSSSTFGVGSTNSGKIRWSADNVYVSGTGTTEFYGSSAGNIAAGTSYGNLWFTGTGTKTIGAGVAVTATGGTASFGVTVTNNLTVNATGSLTVTGMELNVIGPITNNGIITVE